MSDSIPPPNSRDASGLAELAGKIALELAFAEPARDTGLLPINSFVMQLEELAKASAVPAPIVAATGTARQWLDQLFETTVAFDAATLARLAEWTAWMQSAAEQWRRGLPVAEPPTVWRSAAGTSSAAGRGQPGSPAAPDQAAVSEPGLELNLESDGELLREFINESQEHLQNIEQGVLVLEEHPADADTLNSIFRAFHTFKGGSGFLNLTPIKNLAHELESLLDAARQHKLAIDSRIITLILEGADTLKRFVDEIRARLSGSQAGQPILIPTRHLIERVTAALQGSADCPPEAIPAGDQAGAESCATASAAAPPPSGIASAGKSAGRGPGASETRSAGFVKVDTGKLDALIDLVGELVITESMVVHDPSLGDGQSRHLTRHLHQLRRITSELQRTAMSLRMVPVRATFQKMNRVVRDLAAKQRKQVRLNLGGEDTELDRNLIEQLSDPLVHLMRNAVDHGVEVPEARQAKGKPEMGEIHLRAFHQSGNIVIQVQDDGNGLDAERILAKAREQGRVDPADTLSDKEIQDLIFAPGFSTAQQVTDISGRGVGMDVVRRNIEKLRGKVEIDTTPGQGTTFTIYLPLTLAIIDGLIVSVGGERYIIPTLAVRESFRPKAEMLSTLQERGEMVSVRGQLSPLLRLHRHFGLTPGVTDPTEAIVVVVESGGQTRGLLVDKLLGKQEVVIKSLGTVASQRSPLAGGAVLGDGRVGLILDVDSLVKLNGASASRREGLKSRAVMADKYS